MNNIAGSSNGRTSPSGGEYLGSSPSPAANRYCGDIINMKRNLKTYLPGYAQGRIENAHGMIIELRKKKAQLLAENPLNSGMMLGTKSDYLLSIDEKIKQWEEVINLWTGKLDPSRNKLVWSVVVPILISVVITLLVNKLSH